MIYLDPFISYDMIFRVTCWTPSQDQCRALFSSQRYRNLTLPEKALFHAWKAVEDGLENGVDHCEHAVSSSGSSSALDAHHAVLHMLLLLVVSIVCIETHCPSTRDGWCSKLHT